MVAIFVSVILCAIVIRQRAAKNANTTPSAKKAEEIRKESFQMTGNDAYTNEDPQYYASTTSVNALSCPPVPPNMRQRELMKIQANVGTHKSIPVETNRCYGSKAPCDELEDYQYAAVENTYEVARPQKTDAMVEEVYEMAQQKMDAAVDYEIAVGRQQQNEGDYYY